MSPRLQTVKNALRRFVPERMYFRWLLARYLRTQASELSIFDKFIDREKDVIDVGANRGILSHIMAQRCRHVFAYEPHPRLFETLRRNAPSNVTAFPIALSDVNSEATLRVPLSVDHLEQTGLGSLSRDFASQQTMSIKVSTKTLDSLDHKDIGFIKIDVEGHEEAVLRGAVRLLTTQKPVLWIEIEQRYHQNDIRQVFRQLADIGYRGRFQWDGQLRDLSEFDPAEHQRPFDLRDGKEYVQNMLFTPAGN